jgi:hypothetical protein
MSTWGELLADIRADLRDSGETKRWTDEMLFLFTKDAIRAYSADLPLFVYRTELAASNGKFPLPASFLSVVTVELEQGVYLEKFDPRPGRRFIPQARATRFFVSAGYLHLDAPPTDGDTVLLSYRAMHDLPRSEDDLEAVMTVPAEDEELIRIYIRAKVAEQMRLAQASLDRFKPGSGDRDDNPMIPEFRQLMEEFHARVAQKLGGVVTIYQAKRR